MPFLQDGQVVNYTIESTLDEVSFVAYDEINRLCVGTMEAKSGCHCPRLYRTIEHVNCIGGIVLIDTVKRLIVILNFDFVSLEYVFAQ